MVGPARAQIWRLHIAGCQLGFDAGSMGLHQVLAVKPVAGASGMPLTRTPEPDAFPRVGRDADRPKRTNLPRPPGEQGGRAGVAVAEPRLEARPAGAGYPTLSDRRSTRASELGKNVDSCPSVHRTR